MAEAKLQEADHQGRTKITLADGSSKFLKYKYKAVRAFEKKYKEEVGEKINFLTYFNSEETSLMEKLSATSISILIWAGMLGAGSKLSYDDVCDKLDLKQLPEYVPAVFGAIKAEMGGDEEDAASEANVEDPTEASEPEPTP